MEWENKSRSFVNFWHPTPSPDLAFGIGALKFCAQELGVLKAGVQEVTL